MIAHKTCPCCASIRVSLHETSLPKQRYWVQCDRCGCKKRTMSETKKDAWEKWDT